MVDNRLQWRCRRGLLELDILLQRFLARHYDELSPRQRDEFAVLVDMQDIDLWHLVTADQPISGELERTHVLGMLRRTLRNDSDDEPEPGRAH